MKKLFAILCATLLAVGFTGCLEKENSSSPKVESQKTESSPTEIELPEDEF